MAGVPARSGEAYTFYFSVTSQANTNIMQANPAIAAGDFQYSNDAGATFNNPATIPAVTAGNNKVIEATLSGAEMTPSAGDKIIFFGSDQVGNQWQDYKREITVTVRSVDDVSTLAQADILNDATPFPGANVDAAVSSRATQADILNDATPFPGANIDQSLSATEGNIRGADNDDLEDISDQIDALNNLSAADVWNRNYDLLDVDHSIGRRLVNYIDIAISTRDTLGAGATARTYRITDSSGLPISDVDVWVSTDQGGNNIVASGRTDSNGEVTFFLDAGVTYYIWRQRAGYNFSNPDTEVA